MRILLVGAFLALLACSRSEDGASSKSAAVAADVPICVGPYQQECNTSSCGGNSPAINAFPIQGFRPDGECSPEGAQVRPGSMQASDPSSPCDGATLDVQGDDLVGRKDGKTDCKGKALEGVTFEVRGSKPNWFKPQPAARIRIGKVTTFTEPHNGKERTAYRLENADVPGETLCDGSTSKTFRQKLQLQRLTALEELHQPTTALVIPLRSEYFDRHGAPFPVHWSWKSQKPEWLHFSCVDDALAKRSLYDLHDNDVARSRAYLRLLTAMYCKRVPATFRGVKIEWKKAKKIEARWDEHGATCMSRDLRLLYTKPPNRELPPTLPKLLACKPGGACTADSWVAQMRQCENKPKPLPECECPNQNCESKEVTSYIPDWP